MNYDKKILGLIAIATIARIIIASTVELGNDEVYYWTYAQHLQWNYFDHPPIVGWLIRLTTVDLLLHNEIFVRVGAIISSAFCTLIIFQIGTIIKSPQTGWYAALLYTASVYSSIIAGTFILPDSPQMIFWLWSVSLLTKIVNLPTNNKSAVKLWLCFGASAGLCMMSKVHGIFLWFAVVLYAIMYNKPWLKEKSIYISAVITLVIISPIIFWNIQNNFISYTYHESRVSIAGSGINADGFVRELAGQIFYNNPFNFLVIWITLFSIWKGKWAIDKKQVRLLLCCSLPLIIVLLFVSLFRDTLPHWSGPGYSTLLILLAARLASESGAKINRVTTFLKLSIGFIAILSVAGIIIINFFPGTLSPKKSGENLGDGDPTLDMYGWRQAGVKFDSVYRADVRQNIMPANAPIIINKWFPAAHIDFYLTSLTHQQTYALGDLFNIHQYYWYNQYKGRLKEGDAAYYVTSSNLYNSGDIEQLNKNFETISARVVIPVYRNGVICKNYYVYRLNTYHLASSVKID